jgi:hypothetical protein
MKARERVLLYEERLSAKLDGPKCQCWYWDKREWKCERQGSEWRRRRRRRRRRRKVYSRLTQ